MRVKKINDETMQEMIKDGNAKKDFIAKCLSSQL